MHNYRENTAFFGSSFEIGKDICRDFYCMKTAQRNEKM